ncbi:MAG: DUF1049 domain-containing protein [Gammaproteobacteria bacterium]|nr:DUF1049 domain-containing protein [Gammaproteobacteria bacterium]NIR99256.1 DUF1049 domain-containing protein [Gammaproteobacteria bacterium]NIT64877.1 DUF1049 domain-containing protein [Gammaproteobacteria bacterium]NIV21827.1 DUF1049 domain-containing protein [Gammaproteobacteria bacterium]NIX10896.1 DUF1049 domain-containing protein [Gammaproteobacteria bacterium]
MNYKLIAVLVVVGLVVVFVAQNAAVVEIRFLFWNVAISRAVVIFLALAAGVAAGWLLHGAARHRYGRPRGRA